MERSEKEIRMSFFFFEVKEPPPSSLLLLSAPGKKIDTSCLNNRGWSAPRMDNR